MSTSSPSLRRLAQAALIVLLAASTGAALADRAALEAAKAARERARAEARAAAIEAAKAAAKAQAEALARFGMTCPERFEAKLSAGRLLCEWRIQIPVAMNQCPPSFPVYHTRAGRQDACTAPNFLAEGVLEERYEEGTHFVYADEDAAAIARARERLEAGLSGRAAATTPPGGLRDTSRFRPPALSFVQAPEERVVAATTREFRQDGLSPSGEDATLVSFVVYTAAVRVRPPGT